MPNPCPAAPGAVTALLQHLPAATIPQRQKIGISKGIGGCAEEEEEYEEEEKEKEKGR